MDQISQQEGARAIPASRVSNALKNGHVLADDLLRSAAAIAEFYGVSVQQVYRWKATGQIPGLFKLGKQLCARKSVQLAHIERMEQGANV